MAASAITYKNLYLTIIKAAPQLSYTHQNFNKKCVMATIYHCTLQEGAVFASFTKYLENRITESANKIVYSHFFLRICLRAPRCNDNCTLVPFLFFPFHLQYINVAFHNKIMSWLLCSHIRVYNT